VAEQQGFGSASGACQAESAAVGLEDYVAQLGAELEERIAEDLAVEHDSGAYAVPKVMQTAHFLFLAAP
jgi:hypothetical protein